MARNTPFLQMVGAQPSDRSGSTASRARSCTSTCSALHEASSFYGFMVSDPLFADENPDYLLITRGVIPALHNAGVPTEQIDEMMIENPRRFFGQGTGVAVAA